MMELSDADNADYLKATGGPISDNSIKNILPRNTVDSREDCNS